MHDVCTVIAVFAAVRYIDAVRSKSTWPIKVCCAAFARWTARGVFRSRDDHLVRARESEYWFSLIRRQGSAVNVLRDYTQSLRSTLYSLHARIPFDSSNSTQSIAHGMQLLVKATLSRPQTQTLSLSVWHHTKYDIIWMNLIFDGKGGAERVCAVPIRMSPSTLKSFDTWYMWYEYKYLAS